MAAKTRSKKLRRGLSEFRLVTATEIIRNLINTNVASLDIGNDGHITELCDDYALSILLSWLATKYGFPVYAGAIESSSNSICRLEDWPSLRDEYPLGRQPVVRLRQAKAGKLLAALEDLEPAGISLSGDLYEHICEHPLKLDHEGVPYIDRSDKRKLSGQFYTPPYVVSYCLKAALAEDSATLISMIKAAANSDARGDVAARQQFKMIDPSCGTGNFLLGAAQWFAERGLSDSEQYHLVLNCLHGLELDAKAAGICRISLLLTLAKHWSQLAARQTPQQIDKQLGQALSQLRKNITTCDTIFQAPTLEGSYDLAITNPPYVSYGSRNQTPIAASHSRFLRRLYPASTEYKIRLHSVFQEIALKLLREGGKAALLVPDAFLTGSYYRKLRQMLIAGSRIVSITELPDNIIDRATVGNWCVAVYEKRPQPEENYRVEVASISSSNGCSDLKPQRNYQLPISFFVSPDNSRFRLVFNAEDEDIWKQLDQLPRLGQYLTGHTGIRSRSGQSAVVSKSRRDESYRKGIISGSSIRRHKVSWDGNWININPRLLFGGGFDAGIIGNPKLLVRQTGDHIVAAYDDSGLYHLNNVHSFSINRARPKIDLRYGDGVMNSSLWLYLYQSKTREKGRALAQIDIETVECMPVPADDRFSDHISRLVQWSASLCQSQPTDLQFSLERAIDRLVYAAYNLSAAHIDHIESCCAQLLEFSGQLPTESKAAELAESYKPITFTSQ